ncbi:hypothetical protein BS50DRAFT_247200 [Corynespora cassiicola Philippines]|uniref:AMP-activated protein kinase glycogen-binding domain-containing protein n=1 Tax=Corynespora cassiicola Philippines TaxID=1448308 RepID=A0A2T2P4K4_CORCC|nr:hypothetical protein BS50DRAFT_247200 [Corynespora cassiicola Philippines]
MGSYTFTWEHSANEVFVTGDFDDWKQTVKLEKEDNVFKKTVELPKAKTMYKFVVDGNWVTNDSAPKDDDGKGNVNNVLVPDDIKEPVSTLSSAAPESSTAALAADVPKEADKAPVQADDHLPGAFPLTPPADTPVNEPQAFSINPIPATEGAGNPVKLAPGEPVPDPSTLTSNTIQSTVQHEKEPEKQEDKAEVSVAPIPATEGLGNPIKLAPGEPVPEPSTLTSNTIESTVQHEKEPQKDEDKAEVSVAPIPATAGAGNPIHLEPGEKVPDPSTLTSNTISSTAKADEASYNKADSLPPQLGPVVTPQAERDANGGMFGLPSLDGTIIPESSLPKDVETKTEQDPGVTVQSAAPTSTTATLAAEVPKEPKVPEPVVESQKEAGFTPEASANAEAVEEKKEVEEELKEKVPEAPATTETSATEKAGEAAAAGAIAVAAGATAAAGAAALTAESAKDKVAETAGLNGKATASEVPPVVAESQKEAHVSPEAAANPEAVEEKKEVESELLKEVKKTEEAGEPAPTVTAATTETAPALSEEALTDSKPLQSSSEADALNAPADKPAQSEPAKPVTDSRDVSPMSKQPTTTDQSQPTVTTGTETSKAEPKTIAEAPKAEASKSDTPAEATPKVSTAADSSKDTPAESVASGTTDKKKKRRSFFGKLKDKLSSKSSS